jgi:hypothetical protein
VDVAGRVEAMVPGAVAVVLPTGGAIMKFVVVSALVFVIATGTVAVSPGAPTVVEVPVGAPS